jgi:hypothetical protein
MNTSAIIIGTIIIGITTEVDNDNCGEALLGQFENEIVREQAFRTS